jgi:hypothetical protein
MRVFDSGDGWDTKVNFVDDNNVCLGYDMSQDCCEYADWFIQDSITNKIPHDDNYSISEELKEKNWQGWSFDVDFFLDLSEVAENVDEGGLVVFRLTSGKDQVFLHLFNVQNGYYTHGFSIVKSEVELRSGGL